MKCFLELYFAHIRDDDGPEWVRKLRDGNAVPLWTKDFTSHVHNEFDEVQGRFKDQTNVLFMITN